MQDVDEDVISAKKSNKSFKPNNFSFNSSVGPRNAVGPRNQNQFNRPQTS